MEILSLILPNLTDPQVWISLLTLTFLEIVLGVDNIIFISILSDKLPKDQQNKARNIGLGFAMIFRVGLLLTINWLIGLNEPVFSLELFSSSLALSWKDIILLCGGLFLIIKSTIEIHHKMQVHNDAVQTKSQAVNAITMVVIQIILVDMVFSLDSILTAVGLVDNVVSRIINTHPSLQMLALSFLVVIGVLLVAEGIHQHISKNIIYSCLAFSLTVELLNINFRKKQEKAIK